MSDVWIEIEDRENPKSWVVVDAFQEYEVSQDVMTGEGSFVLKPIPIKSVRDLFLSGEQAVRIMCNDALQFTGITDDRDSGASAEGGSYLDLTGRDMSRWLQDVAFDEGRPISTWTLKKFVEYATNPWRPDYISEIVIDDAPAHYIMAVNNRSRYKEKFIDGVLKKIKVAGSSQPKAGKKSPYYRGIDVDKLDQKRIAPGDNRMEKIQTFAAQVGCTVACTATGQLFVGRPSYDRIDYDTLRHGKKTNIIAATFKPSTGDRFAEYKFIAQGRKSKTSKGKINRRDVIVQDPSPAFYTRDATGSLVARVHKPQTINAKNVNNNKILRRLARTTVEWAICQSYGYQIEVYGHGRDGVLWAPNSCVNVEDEYNNISGLHYIYKRRFIKSMERGTISVLHLIPAHIWLHLDHDSITDTAWQQLLNGKVTW